MVVISVFERTRQKGGCELEVSLGYTVNEFQAAKRPSLKEEKTNGAW